MSDGAERGRFGLGRNAIRVAAITAVGLLGIVVLLVISASRDTFTLRAVFDDVRGLIPGGDVTAAAVVVGTVADVELNEDGDPEVTMEIDPDVELHQGAVANIRLASNVGAVNRTLDLTIGDAEAPLLEDGAVLSGESVDNPVDFDLAVSTLTPKTRNRFRKVLQGLDESLDGRGQDFDRTLRHSGAALGETGRLLEQVNRDGESIHTIVEQGARAVGALADDPAELGASTETTARLLAVAGGRQAELAATSEALGPALVEAGALLERTSEAVPTLRELVRGAGPVVDELGPFALQAVPASKAAAPFLDQTRKLVEEAPAALRKQRGFVTKGEPLVREMIPLIDQINPIGDYLRVWTPETIGFFQNVADAAAPYDVNGHGIRVSSALAQVMPLATVAGGSVAPDECSAGLLPKPFLRTAGVNECQAWSDYQSSFVGGGG